MNDNIIRIDASIREAMSVLNRVPVKLCVAVDSSGKLVRTIADGDIRRGLLNGATMDTLLSALSGNQPIAFRQGTPNDVLIEALNEQNNINAIVLTNEKNEPVGLVDRATLRSTILLSPPHLGRSEAEYVQQAFIDNWIAPAGPNLDAFERALAPVAGRNLALALSSGTAALHLALRVLGVERGARVYVSDLTFAASVQPILYQGATPVFIDADPLTWNMSVPALKRRLEKDAARGALPKAVIVVHLYGQPADMDGIMKLADTYGVPVIEDAAESMGASYRNKPSGNHGVLTAFSFNGNKIITTSGGGALVGDCADLISHARRLSTQGRDAAEHYQHSEVAFNYRMSNVLAGIGLGQLQLLDDRVTRRRAIYETYREALQDLPGLHFQEEVVGGRGNRWLTVISFDPSHVDRHAYQLLRRLRHEGIESRPAWKPMHMQPLFAGLELEPHSEEQIVSSALFLQSLCLPSGSSLTQAEQERIIRLISAFARGLD